MSPIVQYVSMTHIDVNDLQWQANKNIALFLDSALLYNICDASGPYQKLLLNLLYNK